MGAHSLPNLFLQLQAADCINESDIIKTEDGLFLVYKSLAEILSAKGIIDFPDPDGERLECAKFYDDWFLYAVSGLGNYTYSLFKLREQEHDAENGAADGDTPGVTISFIAFKPEKLIGCLEDDTDKNRQELNDEINRVVAYRGQKHDHILKSYYKNPRSVGAYYIASLYTKHISFYTADGSLDVPDCYKKIVQRSISYKKATKFARVPSFIESLNKKSGRVVCDNEKIYIENRETPTEYERAAILATHAGNTSVYSFAAEVEYHARFLTPVAKIKIPFFGKSVYDSAIRADMTIGDTEFEGPAPFYKESSRIFKRQYSLHHGKNYIYKI